MEKLFNSLKNVSWVLLIVLLCIMGIFGATGYFMDIDEGRAGWLIACMLEGLVTLALFGLAVVCLLLKKNKLANALIIVIVSVTVYSVLFNGLMNLSVIGVEGVNGLRVAVAIFVGCAALVLLTFLVLFIMTALNDKYKAKFAGVLRLLAVIFVLLEIVAFLLSIVRQIQNENFMGIFDDLINMVVNPMFLLIVYINAFDTLKAPEKAEAKEEETLEEPEEKTEE